MAEGKKNEKLLLLAAGIVLTAVAVFADNIGIGAPGYGWRQIAATLAGIALAVMGAKKGCCQTKAS